MERSLQTLLIDHHEYHPLFDRAHFKDVSSIAAFFYVAMFRVIRSLLVPFRSANPTWLKLPATSERVTVREDRLHQKIREQINAMTAHLLGPSPNFTKLRPSVIEKARSAELPIEDASVDAVISSPPYCTRIDYVKKTLPELALLGANSIQIKHLRDQMIGTPTIQETATVQAPAWGATCLAIVDAIAQHDSYASKSYYYKTYLQYFSGLYESVREIDRVLKPRGSCILVVQDSYYKNIHIDLAKVLSEIGSGLDWRTVARADFPTTRTIVGLNTKAIENGNPKLATETVLAFRKNA
jgi:hypothetical protein